jgi:hypothetical protein
MPYGRTTLAVLLLMCSTTAVAEVDYSAAAEAGYRLDSLDWNIAGWNTDSGTPGQQRSGEYVNVLSELTWSDLQIGQVGLRLTAEERRYQLAGYVAYGEIYSGDNQDSDFDYNNRQGEFSRSNNGVFGDTLDASISLGYRYDVKWGKDSVLHVMPRLGAAIHQQNLGMKNGYQTLYVPYAEGLSVPQAGVPDPSAVGPLTGLNSSYDAEWNTTWLGLDVWRAFTPKLTLGLNLEIHRGDYSAKANWNLRTTLAHPVSFAHWADGHGVVVGLNGQYTITGPLYLSFGLQYGQWTTDPGIDRVYFIDNTSLDSRLNEVNWTTLAANLGLGMSF